MMRSKIGKSRMLKWFVNSLISKAKNAAKGVANAAKKMASQAVSAIGKGIAGAGLKIFNGLVTEIKAIKDQIFDYFNSMLFSQIEQFINCLRFLETISQSVAETIRKFGQAMRTLTSGWAGFVKVFIGAICNWEAFKKAADYLILAYKKHGEERWNLIGKFTGQLIIAIGRSQY